MAPVGCESPPVCGRNTSTLAGRAFDLLLALVEAKGEVVAKEALVRRVWSGTIVDDNSLQVQLFALRKALGEDAALLINDGSSGGPRHSKPPMSWTPRDLEHFG
jgi:DNA-binding response OmpR family regulator